MVDTPFYHLMPNAPPPSPVTCAPDFKVQITTHTTDTEVVVRASPLVPSNMRVEISATHCFMRHGDLAIEGHVSLRPLYYEYVCCCPTPLFKEPSAHAAVLMLPKGKTVRGGLPSSKGWIPLDDDESWIFESAQLRLRKPEVVRVPFTRHVRLPSDVEITHATCEELRRELVYTVPRCRAQLKDEELAHMKAPPPLSPVLVVLPPPPPSAPSLSRAHSSASLAVLETLDGINDQLASFQAACDAADSTLEHTTVPAALDLGLQSQLAALHGDANMLLAEKIDAVLTSELTSGKEHARMQRKSLTKQAERLIERLEAQVRRFDGIRVGSEVAAEEDRAAELAVSEEAVKTRGDEHEANAGSWMSLEPSACASSIGRGA